MTLSLWHESIKNHVIMKKSLAKLTKEQLIESYPDFFAPVQMQSNLPTSDQFSWDLLKDAQMEPSQHLSCCIVVIPPSQEEDGPAVGKIVNYCSPNYGLMDNRDLYTTLYDAVYDKFDGQIRIDFKHSDHSKFYATIRLDESKYSFEIASGDVVFPIIRCHHSYNSQLRLGALFGFARQYCGNDLWSFTKEHTVQLKHTSKNAEIVIDDLMEALDLYLEKMVELKDKFVELSNRKLGVDWSDRIDQVIENTNFPKSKKDDVIARLDFEAGKFPLTDWLVYNAFNFYINYGDHNMDLETGSRLDSRVFSYMYNNPPA